MINEPSKVVFIKDFLWKKKKKQCKLLGGFFVCFLGWGFYGQPCLYQFLYALMYCSATNREGEGEGGKEEEMA